jgi:hypothetical protein
MRDDVNAAAAVVHKLPGARAWLQCGKEAMAALGPKYSVYDVYFAKGQETERAELFHTKMKELPETWSAVSSLSAPPHFDNARCEKPVAELPSAGLDPAKRARACASSPTSPMSGENLVAGLTSYEALSDFAIALSPEGHNDVEEAELLETTLKSFRGDVATVEVPSRRPKADVLRAPFWFFVSLDKEVMAGIEEIIARARVAGCDEVERPPFSQLHFEYHMANEDDAKALEEQLRGYKREVGNRMDGPKWLTRLQDDAAKDRSAEEKVFHLVEYPALWRAWRDARVERRGDTVTFDVEPATSGNEADDAWDAYRKMRTDRARKVAAIVNTLATTGELDQDAVREIAPKLADAIGKARESGPNPPPPK